MGLKYDTTPDEFKNDVPYLDNLLGIKDQKEVLDLEYKITNKRAFELLSSGELNDMPLNMNTLCYIHKELLKDLYPWAGQIRNVDLYKGGNYFYTAQYLNTGIKQLFDGLKKDNNLSGLNEEEFIELYCYYSNELNILHPFREGNGRSKRIFLTELARRAGYKIDYNEVSSEELRNADIEAFGDFSEGKAPNMVSLKILISKMIKPIDKDVEVEESKTVEQLINRFVWIYDRECERPWMLSCGSYEAGEQKIKEMLKSKDGRVKLCELIENTKRGAKTKSTRDFANELIFKIKQKDFQDIKDDEIIK